MEFDGLEVKILGRNLRGKLPKGPRPGKPGRDGDGDGRIDLDLDGDDDDPIPAKLTTTDVPNLPPVQDPVAESTWAERHAKRIERRRKVIGRVQARADRWGKKKPKSMEQMLDLAEAGDVETIEINLRPLFEIDDLGGTGARSIVDQVELIGPIPGSMYPGWGSGPGVLVNGRILDKDGNEVGHFIRDFDFESGTIHHAELELEEDARGGGIGSDFITDTESQYSKLGIKAINVEAGLEDGPYTWAVAGFDWASKRERDRFLGYMYENIVGATASCGPGRQGGL